MSKDKKKHNNREVFDIPKLRKAIEKNSTVMEPIEYVNEKMPIYAANVNLRRQIPEIRDGLLPVQRRILITMYNNGLYRGKKIKSAKITGDVMKLHPHGDSSIYNSMVLLGQNFRNNITFINKTGNFGSAWNSSGYAASRYTEASLSDFAYDCYFADWNLKNPKTDMVSDWIPNFDETELEPMYLPGKYPVFLLLWQRHLGIGRYCSVFGFNLTEAFDAVIKLIKDPEAKFALYPDDPEGCDLINSKDMKNILDATDLTVKMRGTYNINHYNGHDVIEITSAPFEVDPITVMDAIKNAADKGKLPEISDISGCSEDLGENFKLSIEVRKGYDPDAIMSKIYKLSQLENTYTMKYAFVNGLQSADYTLRIAILEWLRCRRETLNRIHKSKLIYIIKRVFFLEPLIKVIESGQIEEFVRIVRTNTEEVAIKKIMEGWDLTDYQAEKIVGVKISDLSKDKLPKYKEELKELNVEKDRLNDIVNNHDRLNDIIISDLREGIKKYGAPRKSEITQLIDAIKISDTDHYLIFTDKYIKKLPYEEKGYRIGKLDINEKVRNILVANNRDVLAICTSDGRCNPIIVNDIPNSNLQSNGINYTNIKSKNNGYSGVINLSQVESDGKCLVSVTKQGLITKTSTDGLIEKTNSFALMKVDKGDEMVDVCIADEDDRIMVYTKSGKCAIFPFDDFETTAANTKGVQAAKLENDEIIGVMALHPGDESLVTLTDRGYVKKVNILTMPTTKRNGRLVEINSTNGVLTDCIAVTSIGEDPLYIATTDGAYVLDHMNIKSTNRLGKNERAVALDQKNYAIKFIK